MSWTGTPFCTFLTAWGDASFLLLGILPGLLFDLYSWKTSMTFLFGLACRPADLYIALVSVVALFRGTPILAGGIGVARFVVWVGFLFVCFVVSATISQCVCLSRDWTRCHAALGAKIKGPDNPTCQLPPKENERKVEVQE